MKDNIKLPDGRTAMNLFELMDAIDAIDERVKEVEKQSHEPQNYKKKCDEMETRIKKLEQKLKTLIRYKK
jgi:peptidoglycan hydrolase CwlO-like protein|tara:strand:+ start:730 stop:939 length:210 start_codon:yes stop_codon:yes gene_type:complete